MGAKFTGPPGTRIEEPMDTRRHLPRPTFIEAADGASDLQHGSVQLLVALKVEAMPAHRQH
eukprot:2010290-Lingulodinium_polyedra.AAC.1